MVAVGHSGYQVDMDIAEQVRKVSFSWCVVNPRKARKALKLLMLGSIMQASKGGGRPIFFVLAIVYSSLHTGLFDSFVANCD